MQYTEKERKGIDKVTDMNRFFDKILLPAVGVLVIITLLFFIAGRVKEKFGGAGENTASGTVTYSAKRLQKALDKRDTLMNDYEANQERWTEGGYVRKVLSEDSFVLERKADEELTVLQISDTTLGNFTTLSYKPSDGKYDMLSLTVSKGSLFTVTLSGKGYDDAVTFPSPAFRPEEANEKEACDHLLKVITRDDLVTLYEIFLTDIEGL